MYLLALLINIIKVHPKLMRQNSHLTLLVYLLIMTFWRKAKQLCWSIFL